MDKIIYAGIIAAIFLAACAILSAGDDFTRQITKRPPLTAAGNKNNNHPAQTALLF